MKVEYEITKSFENNHLFDSDKNDGIQIKMDDQELIIKGSSRDLVELADVLVSVAVSKEKREHIHLDTDTILNHDSEISEIIIEKE